MKKCFCIILAIVLTILITACFGERSYSEDEVSESISSVAEEAYNRGYEDACEECYPEAYAEGYSIGHQQGYDEGTEVGYDTGWEDSNIESIENYYESLCNYYGFLTYYDVKYLRHIEFYITNDDRIFHSDYFCEYFSRDFDYVIYTEETLPDGVSPCDKCENTESFFYLDSSNNTFHYPYHIQATTNDFINTTSQYYRVSYSSAVSHNAIPCPECTE